MYVRIFIYLYIFTCIHDIEYIHMKFTCIYIYVRNIYLYSIVEELVCVLELLQRGSGGWLHRSQVVSGGIIRWHKNRIAQGAASRVATACSSRRSIRLVLSWVPSIAT